jgi:muramoyltetrapeptide carboxypeptidase
MLSNQLNRRGKTKAPVVGGNLSLLAHAVGTNAELNTDGKILFIEDISEQLYNIERMLLQLIRSGKLKKLKGLIVGGFTQNKDTERPFGKDVHQLIHDLIQEYKFPVCYDFPVGHEKENVALAIGTTYKLEVEEDLTTLSNC